MQKENNMKNKLTSNDLNEALKLNDKQNKLILEYIFPKGRKDANECTEDELLDLEEVF